MRGGKDGGIPTDGSQASSPHGVVGTEGQRFADKGKSHGFEGETPVRKERTLLHIRGKTTEQVQKYRHVDLEEVRAHAKYAGLGFYGIHDDDTLRNVLNGGDYDPSSTPIPHPRREETDGDKQEKLIKKIKSRITIGSKEPENKGGAGTTIEGEEAKPTRPVLAISNYFNFCQSSDRQKIMPYYESLRRSIMGYLSPDGGNVAINAMHIMTAAMHRADSGRQREKTLKEYPAMFRGYMIDLFGEDNLKGYYNFHLCDPDLECVARSRLGRMEDFVSRVKLPTESSCFDIRNVNDADIVSQLIKYIKDNEINLIYFIGGETHWLNRQLTKCKFNDVLGGLGEQKIVFVGCSAGLINIGSSSYITACKNYEDPSNDYYDDVSDLCDEHGTRIADIDPFSGPNEQDTGCAPEYIGDPLTKIKYDTLGVSPHVYFPHFDLDYIGFLEYVEGECKGRTKPNVVLTDGMMAYTNEGGKTSFIFADPGIEEVLGIWGTGVRVLKEELVEYKTYSEVLVALGAWYDKEDNKDKFRNYSQELLAYLHSCMSIPLDRQMRLVEDNGGSPGSDGGDQALRVGGANKPNICGTMVGLVISVALAFVKR